MNALMEKDPRSLRVLYVIPGEDHGVNMSFSRSQAAAVSALGVDVRSFYLQSRTSPRKVWKEIRRLRREVKEFAPSVVHAHFGTVTAFVAAIATLSPVTTPLVVTFHGSDLNPAPSISLLRSKLGHAFSHIAARRAAQIICVSSQLHERLPQLKERLNVVPCGVDRDQFQPQPKMECREKLGWDFDETVVLFNARTDPLGKRLDLAEAAAEIAKQKIPKLRLHIFRGKTPPDEMPIYYSAADGLLMTSDYEGSPMVVKEALACNLPIVSVDVGDVVERLTDVSQSVVVAREPVALGTALVEILRKDCPSNGREMSRDLGEESIAEQIISIYQRAIGREEHLVIDDFRDRTEKAPTRPYQQAV